MDVSNNPSKGTSASGASSNISGKRSNNDREIKKPAEKAQTIPMLFFNFFTNSPAERVAKNAIITDNTIGRVFIKRIILDLSDSSRNTQYCRQTV